MFDDERVVVEDLAQERLVAVGVDPGGAEVALHVFHAQVLGDHLAQRGDVDLKLGARGGRGDRDVELVADVARQVLGGGHELAAAGVLIDQLAERVAGLVGGRAQQRRDLLEVDAAVGLDADGERVVGVVDAEHRGAGDQGALREHRRRDRGLRRFVEALKRHDERRERVAAQRVHDARRDARDARLARRVGAAGGARAEAVDRPVACRVGAVAVAQLRAQPVGVIAVLNAGRLGLKHRLGAVTQAQ